MAAGVLSFDSTDGLPPIVVQKLNQNFQQLLREAAEGGSPIKIVPTYDTPPAYGGDQVWLNTKTGALSYATFDVENDEWVWQSVAAVDLVDLQEQVDAAIAIAEATGQHFWHDDNGAHVTQLTEEEWDAEVKSDDPFSGQGEYANILINSLGVLLRDALTNLLAITPTAASFYDGDGNTDDNITASFGRDGVVIGKQAGTHIVTTDDRMSFMYNGAEIAYIALEETAPDFYEGVFSIARGVLTDSLYIGRKKWKLYVRNNGNLSLKWIG